MNKMENLRTSARRAIACANRDSSEELPAGKTAMRTTAFNKELQHSGMLLSCNTLIHNATFSSVYGSGEALSMS
jgi:hypothetical protein